MNFNLKTFKISIPEELLIGEILLVLPAYNPINGEFIKNLTLIGPSAKYFKLEPETGKFFAKIFDIILRNCICGKTS